MKGKDVPVKVYAEFLREDSPWENPEAKDKDARYVSKKFPLVPHVETLADLPKVIPAIQQWSKGQSEAVKQAIKDADFLNEEFIVECFNRAMRLTFQNIGRPIIIELHGKAAAKTVAKSGESKARSF